MKKILQITNRLVIGGPSKHVAMLANALQADYEVMVVGGTAAPGEVLALDLFAGLKNEPILIPELSRKLSLSRDYKVYRKLRKIIQDFQPDIVHTHTSKVGALGRYAAKKEGVSKIIHTYHGLIYENYFSGIINKGLIHLDRYLASFTNQIIALSHTQKELLSHKYHIADSIKINIIPLALNLNEFMLDNRKREEFRQKYHLKPETIAIGIIGRLAEIKNIKLFIESIRYLKGDTSTIVKAFIVGDGPEKETLKLYTRELGLSCSDGASTIEQQDIYFTSWCKDLNFVLSGLDIVALTSLNEGTPMSIMEAQSAGKAIIASRVGGVEDILPEGTGFLFEVSKSQMYFEELLKLVEDKDLRNQLGNNAADYSKQKYDITIMIDKMLDVYQS